MNDLIYTGVFLVCLFATLGLLRLCEALMPRMEGGLGRSTPVKEAGR